MITVRSLQPTFGIDFLPMVLVFQWLHHHQHINDVMHTIQVGMQVQYHHTDRQLLELLVMLRAPQIYVAIPIISW